MNYFNKIKGRAILIICLLFLSFAFNSVFAQEKPKGYVFEKLNEVKTTPVKNQWLSGTCWCFATTSFVETEMLRMGKDPLDISEAFFIYQNYLLKADKYIRLHGNYSFSCGGQAHDVMNALKLFGALPEQVYSGLMNGEKLPDQMEMDEMLKAAMTIVAKKEGTIKPNWKEALEGILDAYMGKIPENFDYKSKKYNPKTFAADVIGINPDDYVELTSFSHHPFYSKFILEVPDNWSMGEYYNLPVDDLMSILENALKKGYSVAWDGDVSENEFKHKKNVAVLPVLEWKDRTNEQKESLFDAPEPEKKVTQQMRQDCFDNFSTTDDHLMHIVGMAKDEKGTIYYYVKNSWGEKSNSLNGFLYMSDSYIRLKTIAIMVHKDAIPADIKKKLKL